MTKTRYNIREDLFDSHDWPSRYAKGFPLREGLPVMRRASCFGHDPRFVNKNLIEASQMENQDAIDAAIVWMLADPKEIPNLMPHPLRTLLMERNPSCRCGNMFCGSRRYSDKHGCLFDYHGTAHDAIVKANPFIKAEKLNKI
ncbi:uncharacterized protein LOC124946300 [Impatiens glandulifera]|uniref:uncharacterized protein LOC124946300 n=1 Tax=Impatiens glandulifera TaxID=253017 RepID=UPI001FB1771D|nr:uncharacterized protein LOC124946300 [Impatiens glandulifera]